MLELANYKTVQIERGSLLRAALRQLSGSLRQSGIETADLDVRLLAAEACGLSPEQVIVEHDLVLTPIMAERLEVFAGRRLSGEPVSRILGRREFWGLPIHITPHTLDPRHETELLVEAVLEFVETRELRNAHLRVLDLGTGSGCLLAAILTELPFSFVVGVDRSIEALEAASENLSRLGLRHRAALLCADWMDALGDGAFDIVLGNPPYVASGEIRDLRTEVRTYDPGLALDGGADGLGAYRAILKQVFRTLRRGGFLALETGYSQARTVKALMAQAAAACSDLDIRILTDLEGVERAVAGVRQSKCYDSDFKKKIGNPVHSL
jgi:release factor glutamine methyltransferase